MQNRESGPSDAELLLAYRKGRLDAFATLYDRYGDRLFFYARTLTDGADTAEDVVQESFVRLLQMEPRGPEVRLAPFLFTVARNLAVDQRRRATARGKAALVAAKREPESEAESEFGELLEMLPQEQREIVFLKIHTGLTFAEIAEITGLKLPTVASRYRYALEKLSDSLAPERMSR